MKLGPVLGLLACLGCTDLAAPRRRDEIPTTRAASLSVIVDCAHPSLWYFKLDGEALGIRLFPAGRSTRLRTGLAPSEHVFEWFEIATEPTTHAIAYGVVGFAGLGDATIPLLCADPA